MSKKENSAFLRSKAQVLRDFGIEAMPVSEMVVVGINYNENHVSAYAEGKGISVEEFMKEVDARAKGEYEAPKDPADTDVEKSPAKKAPAKKTAVAPKVVKETEPELETPEVEPNKEK